MKSEILELRAEGKTYDEIKATLGCSKGTISHHCGEGQKEKTRIRSAKYRGDKPLETKLGSFKSKSMRDRFREFRKDRNKKSDTKYLPRKEELITEKDIFENFRLKPICYLSGREIDLTKSLSYHFDHIVPVNKGGDASLSNVGLACKEANLAKSDLLLEDFLNLCKDILVHNGYKVLK